jgi:Flp pilus assembly protein TadD
MTMTPAIEALYATGHWLLGQERHADAATVFRAMALSAPSDERAWLALGICHERAGQLLLASELYKLATEVASPAVRCSIARGRALRALGRDDEATDAFEAAVAWATELGDENLARVADEERSEP